MKYILHSYAGFSASQIRDRATPGIAQMAVVGDTVECIIIPTTGMKGAINESTNALSQLCNSANANKWSFFGPREWYWDGTELQDRARVSKKFGHFAGYNHNALPPVKPYYNTEAKFPSGGGNVNIWCDLLLREIDWRTIPIAQIESVRMEVREYSSLLQTQTLAYTDTRQQNGFNFSVNVNRNSNTTLTVSLVFVNNVSDTLSIPNITNHTVYVSEVTGAVIGDVRLDDLLQNIYPTGVLRYNESTSEVNHLADTFTLRQLRIDENGDGEGDVMRFNVQLFARKNYDKWISVYGPFTMTTGDGVNIIDQPLALSAGDWVEFELRDAL